MTVCQVCGKPNSDDARFCFSCGTALSQAPPVKVEVKSPLGGSPGMTAPPMMPMVPPTYSPRQLARQGSCYYHAELPSTYICSRCGRSICTACARQYGVLNFCYRMLLRIKLENWLRVLSALPVSGRIPAARTGAIAVLTFGKD